MKKIKFANMAVTAVLTLAFAMLTVVSAGIVRAQPNDEESQVDINFVEGGGAVPPVDPDEPSEPLDPDEENPGEGTGQSGALALNYISPITFGNKQLSAATKEYNATTMRPFVQVTDLRGTGVGWRLTAEAQPFRNAAEEISLKGSVITLRRGEAVSAYEDIPKPGPLPVVTLPTAGGHTENVVKAESEEGLGTWVTRWYPSESSPPDENDSVTLTVLPLTAATERYTAKITWTLISDIAP